MEPRSARRSHSSPSASVLSVRLADGPSGNWFAWHPQIIRSAGRLMLLSFG